MKETPTWSYFSILKSHYNFSPPTHRFRKHDAPFGHDKIMTFKLFRRLLILYDISSDQIRSVELIHFSFFWHLSNHVNRFICPFVYMYVLILIITLRIADAPHLCEHGLVWFSTFLLVCIFKICVVSYRRLCFPWRHRIRSASPISWTVTYGAMIDPLICYFFMKWHFHSYPLSIILELWAVVPYVISKPSVSSPVLQGVVSMSLARCLLSRNIWFRGKKIRFLTAS